MAHTHAPANYGRAFTIGVALNLGFVLLEWTYARLSNLLALQADAGHNLSDVLGLVAVGASYSGQPSAHHHESWWWATLAVATDNGNAAVPTPAVVATAAWRSHSRRVIWR